MQKLGLIPEKFILLKASREKSLEEIKRRLEQHGTPLSGEELDKAVETTMQEFEMNIKGVKECFDRFYFEQETDLEEPNNTIDGLKRLIQLKLNSPKRPPRLVILGPPGSGRSSQARAISETYGLVHISTMQLL